MLMARYGAVCDNVLATEVVLADGRLVAANPREHADLFWAIRGGGGNFGIVTSFEYQLFRLDSVLSGLFYFPVSRTADVLRVYRDLIAEAPGRIADRWWADGHAARRRSDGVFLLLRRSRVRASASPIGGGSGCGQRRTPCRPARTRRSSRWVTGRAREAAPFCRS